jgi:hypothetical protein
VIPANDVENSLIKSFSIILGGIGPIEKWNQSNFNSIFLMISKVDQKFNR